MDKIKNVPEIRFDGFDDEWNVLQLKDLGQKYTSLTGKTKNDFGHGDGRYVTFSNVLANPVSSINGVEKIEVDNSQNDIKFGDLFFNISSETYDEVGMSSVWTHDVENYYLNSFCMGFRPSVKMDNHFITYLLRSRSVRKQIMKLAQGISRINISQTKMMDILLQIPYVEEQTQIGTFFKNIDEKLELEKEKHEKLINFKKAMFEDMFPKEGEKVPKLRFDGFEGEWEECNLYDHSEVISGYSFSSEEFGRGKNKLIRISNLLQSGKVGGDFVMVNHNDVLEGFKVLPGDYLIAMSGATTGKIAQSQIEGYLNQRVGLFRTKDSLENEFLAGVLKHPNFFNYISSTWTAAAQPNISVKQIRNYAFMIPCISEQIKIGEYFKNLDEKIEISANRIKKIENFKKSMMDKMFI